MKNVERNLLCMIVAVFFLAPGSLWAINAPGLDFQIEYQPDLIELPTDYKDTYTTLFAAHEALLKIPGELKEVEKAYKAREKSVEANKSLNPVQLRAEHEKARMDYQAQVDAIHQKNAELRDGFVLIANDTLSKGSDPFILFFLAQQLYEIRTQSASMSVMDHVEETAGEGEAASAVEEAKPEAPAGEAAPAPAVEEAKPEAPAGEAAPVEKKEETKAPAPAPQKYANNYDRMVAACNEILNRHSEFPYKDKVLRMLLVIKGELGFQRQSIKLIKLFIKRYPNSQYIGEMYFRMGEHYFKEPTGFDHYSKAVESYERAMKYYKPSRDYWRIMYKTGWAQYLSHDMSEDALDTFVALYKQMDLEEEKTPEMLAIKAEVIEVLRQIKAVDNMGGGEQFVR